MEMVMLCVFSGERDDANPRLAAARLRHAGVVVHELPQRYRALLDHPKDDFLEVVCDAADKAAMNDRAKWIGRLVKRYGGMVEMYGTAGQSYVPFKELFAAATEEMIEAANRRARRRTEIDRAN
jgi:hypothetical protein